MRNPDSNFIPKEFFSEILDPKMRSNRGATLCDRFVNMRNITADDCHLWTGGSDAAGYGAMMIDGRRWLLHRLMWIFHNGRIPNNMIIRHKVCGNRRCFNIEHLAIGTQKENIADTMRQGRHVLILGERHPNSKFTDAQIVEMRNSDLSFMEVVRTYGGSEAAVHNILTGKTWKHVGGRIREKMNARGSAVGAAKLTEELVREIKRSDETTAKLAKRLNVSWHTINDVRKGKYWGHVAP